MKTKDILRVAKILVSVCLVLLTFISGVVMVLNSFVLENNASAVKKDSAMEMWTYDVDPVYTTQVTMKANSGKFFKDAAGGGEAIYARSITEKEANAKSVGYTVFSVASMASICWALISFYRRDKFSAMIGLLLLGLLEVSWCAILSSFCSEVLYGDTRMSILLGCVVAMFVGVITYLIVEMWKKRKLL